MKSNQISRAIFNNEIKLNHWFRLQHESVVCPWCYNLTMFFDKQEINECEVCRRTITEGDLENDIA
ncbi:MAG: hypothetical protein KDC90_19125 [Ignavibacteriae bacterium]|nr:hypothetical protein [Ignavibacteriota bacterium]